MLTDKSAMMSLGVKFQFSKLPLNVFILSYFLRNLRGQANSGIILGNINGFLVAMMFAPSGFLKFLHCDVICGLSSTGLACVPRGVCSFDQRWH